MISDLAVTQIEFKSSPLQLKMNSGRNVTNGDESVVHVVFITEATQCGESVAPYNR